MNGYVKFKATDGEEVAINADNVSYVQAYRKSDTASIIYFEKGHYLIVAGSLDETISALAEA